MDCVESVGDDVDGNDCGSGLPSTATEDIITQGTENSIADGSSSKPPNKTTPSEILADLKLKAASLGIDIATNGATNALASAAALTPVGARGRGRGTVFRGRLTPRGGGISRFNLDLRPRTLLVRAFENPSQENVKAHFEVLLAC